MAPNSVVFLFFLCLDMKCEGCFDDNDVDDEAMYTKMGLIHNGRQHHIASKDQPVMKLG